MIAEKNIIRYVVLFCVVLLLVLGWAYGLSDRITDFLRKPDSNQIAQIGPAEKTAWKFDLSAIKISFPNLIHNSRLIETDYALIYLPSGLENNRKYPVLIAFHPSGAARAMVNAWKGACEKHKWIMLASKNFRNGIDPDPVFKEIIDGLKDLEIQYPVDRSRLIAAGFSGGGMASHLFIWEYPMFTRAIVTNCGVAHPSCLDAPDRYPRGRCAVFLASSGDNNLSKMLDNKQLLDSLGYRTRWIEFSGGHVLAPAETNEAAADWLAQFI